MSSVAVDTGLVSDGSVLSYLLAPLSSKEFVSRFWGRQPLFIKGPKEKFHSLFSMDSLEESLAKADQKQVHVRASFDRGATHTEVAPSQAMAMYGTGATLCVQGLEAIEPRFESMIHRVARDLSFAGKCDVRVYLSPDGQGFDTHFDRRIATTLQIEGHKRWRYSREVALEWPHYQIDSTQMYPADRIVEGWERCKTPSECTFEEVTLEPGDLLCLPSGCWHSAQALGHSLAVNLAFESLGLWGVLAPVLGLLLVKERDWRCPPPLVLAQDREPDALPDLIQHYLSEKLAELIGLLENLRADRGALYETWTRCMEYGDPRGVSSGGEEKS